MKIVTDSREQKPYSFPGQDVEVSALPVGDYSLSGGEDLISIERKELGDLINCLSHDRDRFERELYRMRSLDYGALVIELSLEDIACGRYRSDMNPKAAVQYLLAFSIRYRLPIFFCGSREYGQRVTESLLNKYAVEIEKKFKAVST